MHQISFLWMTTRPRTVLISYELVSRRSDCPALSLNPLEHGWDQLKRRIQARARQPRDLPELRVAVVEEWNELPQNNFNMLVRSMRRRCQAVIDARGGNTRY